MTFVLEREFEREDGLRAHGSKYTKDDRVKRHIKSGGQIILHRLSEDIMTSNVFGVLEKLEPIKWLKPLLSNYFPSPQLLRILSDSNYDRDKIQFHFWHELGRPKRPKGHEEGSTQVDLLVVMPQTVVSFEIKLSAELFPEISTDKEDPMKKRTRVPDPTLRWDQVIRNLERGYVYTKNNYPDKTFLLFILAMEEESKRTPFYSRYKNHPEEIQRQIESGYRWNVADIKYFNDAMYQILSQSLAWMTWTELAEILEEIKFQTTDENSFKDEVTDYIRRKVALYQEVKNKGTSK